MLAVAARRVAGGALAAPAPRGGRRRGRGRGAVASLPGLVALRGGEVAAYHGVEHKAIAAYEQGDGDARDAAKEHDRCGSHLMAPLLAANLAGAALLRRGRRASGAGWPAPRLARLDRRPRSRSSPGPSATANARSPARCAARPTSSSALLGTREPNDAQLEVGRAALEEILRVEARALSSAPQRWPMLGAC